MRNKKFLFTILFALLMLACTTTKSNASLYLNNLDFQAKINEDGSMDVTEIWNIDISYTNTLYKTFNIDRSRYSSITNVKVSEVGGNDFTKTNTWEYHLKTNTYFGGINNDGKFEIAWGTGMENSGKNIKTYKISYKVEDVIAKYDDYAELYWQFIGENFEIDAENVSGTITLPSKASSKEDIKVWGHIDTLNGEIYVTDLDKVNFKVDNYNSGRYLEIRIVMPKEMITSTGRTYSSNILSDVLKEETKWAEDANIRREEAIKAQEREKKTIQTILIIIAIIVTIITIVFITKIKKYRIILKNMKKYTPTIKLDYYRDLPDETATPAEAIFIAEEGNSSFTNKLGSIFSSTLLDLTLKKYIEINVEENIFKKDKISIKILNKNTVDLSQAEKPILRFLINAMKGESEITVKKLQKYISSNPENIEDLINSVKENTETEAIEKYKFNKEEAEKFSKYIGLFVIYLVFAIFTLLALPLSIVSFINAILTYKIAKRCNVLTQVGIDEKEKWIALKKYMLDFSLLNEKEVPALVLWEKYLVFATAFGISEKVLKQLKIVYTDIENMNEFNGSVSCVYLMSHTDFNSSFSNAINSSFTTAMSSGSGRRRRILWRRRTAEEAGGRRWRKIN